ncbi:MAG: class SAM-dependent methyltransferase [Frankiales bacterium]|nr:class SAM-dependent methyltransferase [Frankiales bacterium]
MAGTKDGASRGPRLAAGRARALGIATRGTTNPNRLRRMDLWIVRRLGPLLRRATDPLVIDLGYGHSPITAIELFDRLRACRSDVRVLGLEIDAARVTAAAPASRDGMAFAQGGFELAGRRPVLVRAANVLRQYPETAVPAAWSSMQRQLAAGGMIVDGTSDELGRRSSWVLLDHCGPISLTLSCRVDTINRPTDLADRLVKALIHRNVAGEGVHELLQAMDRAWDRHASLRDFGARQRWQAMARSLSADWPLLDDPLRPRPGELTVAWSAVAPRADRPMSG